MRFRLDHPHDRRLRAEYGWDAAVGFFVEAWFPHDTKPTLSFSALDDEGYDQRRPLRQALEVLAELGFFTLTDLDEAIRSGDELLPEEMPKRLRRVAEVVENFKAGAD